MKAGDLVCFRPPYYIASVDGVTTPQGKRSWLAGLLIERHEEYEMTTILYCEEVYRIPTKHVKKYDSSLSTVGIINESR